MEKYNEQMKNEYEMQRNVIFNAIINSNRKKNTRMISLFQDESDEKTTEEIVQEREELFGSMGWRFFFMSQTEGVEKWD